MTIDGDEKIELPVDDVINAINDLPILERLEIARNLLLRSGGSKDALEPNAVMVFVHDLIHDVIKVLDKHPRAAKLRTPEHRLG